MICQFLLLVQLVAEFDRGDSAIRIPLKDPIQIRGLDVRNIMPTEVERPLSHVEKS